MLFKSGIYYSMQEKNKQKPQRGLFLRKYTRFATAKPILRVKQKEFKHQTSLLYRMGLLRIAWFVKSPETESGRSVSSLLEVFSATCSFVMSDAEGWQHWDKGQRLTTILRTSYQCYCYKISAEGGDYLDYFIFFKF